MLLALFSAGAGAGSNLFSEKELHYASYLNFGYSRDGWDQDGNLQDSSCDSESQSFSHSLSYGYSYYYTLLGSTSLVHSRCGADQKQGLGDVRIGLRGRLNMFMNDRAWEVGLNIPTNRDIDDPQRIDCGRFGIDGGVARRDKLSPWVSVGGEARAYFWESPLAHQAEASISASGPIGLRSYWGWYSGLAAKVPISSSSVPGDSSLSDCGTESKLLRGTWQLKYSLTRWSNLACGLGLSLWGEDASRRRSLYCGYARTWE